MLKDAIIFTVGCTVLVANACLCFIPFSTTLHLPGGVIYIEGILSVLSCTLFLVGSVFSFYETLYSTRQDRNCYFGVGLGQMTPDASVENILENGTAVPVAPDDVHWLKHHNNSDESLISDVKEIAPATINEKAQQPQKNIHTITSIHHAKILELRLLKERSRNFRSRTFIAAILFLGGSIIYTGTAIASLITILTFSRIDRWVRYPQLIAAVGFTIASTILMIKCQTHWWKPAVKKLQWQINLWNLIGSVGFIFCAVFGLVQDEPWVGFQFGCSYLWGSWAFLLGSGIQWYKAFGKYKLRS